MAKKISPKVQQATEEYLASLGSSREQLSEEQWKVVANNVKTEKFMVPIFLVFGAICACLCFLYFRLGKNHIAEIVPDETIFVSEAANEFGIELEPDDIRRHIDYVTHQYLMTGLLLGLTVFLFTGAFVAVPLIRREKQKTYEAFILRS